MNSNAQGRLVILSGPSGVGKDTVLDAWRAADSNVVRVVAYTTRPMRPGERDGIDYHFVSREAFQRRIGEGAFLEYKEVHKNFYGTPTEAMEALLAEGRVTVLKIDVQGALAVIPKRPNAMSVFLMPPSLEELERRLRDRGTDSEEVVQLRIKNARAEMELSKYYSHVIVNREVPETVQTLQDLAREGVPIHE